MPALARAEVTASFTASRSDGVAPLAVFFDAGASACDTCAEVVDPWHDLAYRWDFGDPSAGTWTFSSRSKARDVGPTAAHVFDAPGHYVITLKVVDPATGEAAETTHELDVADPELVFAGDKTICYRATDTGDFDGCPVGALQKTNGSFNAAYGECAAADHRCLFRRGDTFTAGASVIVNASAPTILGAFGDGAAPTIDAAGIGASWLFQLGADGDDYRFMDLRVTGPAISGSYVLLGRRAQRDALFLRIEATSATWHGFALMDVSQNTDKDWHERVFLVENKVLKSGFGNGGNTVYSALKDSALLGNDFQDCRSGEHVFRAEAFDNVLLGHNRLGPGGFAKTAITMRSVDQKLPCAGNICGPSRRAHILANSLRMNHGWTVQACGYAMGQENVCEDVLLDGNYLFVHPDFPLAQPQVAIVNLADTQVVTRRTTFRNNLCNLTSVGSWCVEQHLQTLARAVNNTCVRTDGGALDCVHGVTTPPGGVSTIARNNLVYGTGTTKAIVGAWGTEDHNLVAAMNPFAAAVLTTNPADYALAIDSPAIDAGAPTSALSDYAGLPRPAGDAFDLGVWELGAVEETTGGEETTGTTTDTTDTTGGATDTSDTTDTTGVTTTTTGGATSNGSTSSESSGASASSTGSSTVDAGSEGASTSGDASSASSSGGELDGDDGCACATGAPGGGAGLLGVGLLALTRRRRR
ncbi:MAG: PKD domain-containing protein [Nannocystaceae bacterium]